MFIPYASVYTVSTSAASGLVWKCSLEGQHIFCIMAARIVAELRRFVAESFISADGYRRRKGRNEMAQNLFTTAHDDRVLLCLGQSRWSGLGLSPPTGKGIQQVMQWYVVARRLAKLLPWQHKLSLAARWLWYTLLVLHVVDKQGHATPWWTSCYKPRGQQFLPPSDLVMFCVLSHITEEEQQAL